MKPYFFTDTHAHIHSEPLSTEINAVLARALEANVQRILTIGTDLADSVAAAGLAGRVQGIYAAAGVHPHDARDFSLPQLSELEALLKKPGVVAVGEVGLDYFRNHSPREAQMEVFAMMCDLALSSGLPLVIHSRDAAQDTADILDGVFGNTEHPIIFHCFDGSRLLLDWGLRRERCYYSFAGNLTYPKAAQLHEALQGVPADRLFIETDAPYLAPSKMRGKQNEPSYMVMTVAYMAQDRGFSEGELARRLEANFTGVFGELECM